MFNRFSSLLAVFLTVFVLAGCDGKGADDGANNDEDVTCERTCEKIAECAGGADPSVCLGSCSQLTQPQRQCIVTAANCGAAQESGPMLALLRHASVCAAGFERHLQRHNSVMQ